VSRLVTWALIALAMACGDSTAPDGRERVPQGVGFTLDLGETVRVTGTDLKITFAHVVDDSRCHPMAYCVWAGNATVVVDIERSGEPVELFQLCTHPYICPDAVRIDDHRLEMLELDPPSLPRSALEYRVTLRVSAD
jgi:hypothetical protein